jgi:hypothetical protein
MKSPQTVTEPGFFYVSPFIFTSLRVILVYILELLQRYILVSLFYIFPTIFTHP